MKGFTLLEVLIALAVLSISMLGVYRLSAMSVETSQYAMNKALVAEAGYQRVLEILNYPGKVFRDNGKNPLGDRIYYSSQSDATILPGVDEISLTAEYNGVKTVYVYYEKN
jgi:prepilin-type N-terminal cleavage/methylation domain-containing protein